VEILRNELGEALILKRHCLLKTGTQKPGRVCLS
jgi:hypothetical protein